MVKIELTRTTVLVAVVVVLVIALIVTFLVHNWDQMRRYGATPGVNVQRHSILSKPAHRPVVDTYSPTHTRRDVIPEGASGFNVATDTASVALSTSTLYKSGNNPDYGVEGNSSVDFFGADRSTMPIVLETNSDGSTPLVGGKPAMSGVVLTDPVWDRAAVTPDTATKPSQAERLAGPNAHSLGAAGAVFDYSIDEYHPHHE